MMVPSSLQFGLGLGMLRDITALPTGRCRPTLHSGFKENRSHTLEFHVDESGCFPIVVNHHITLRQPAYYVERYLKLRGQKVMSTEVRQGGEVVFRTGVLGKLDLARELRASLPGRRLRGRRWLEQNGVKCTDLDEVTGRILVVIGTVPDQGADNIPYARRLCLVDLPI